jgi:hypothetical protein
MKKGKGKRGQATFWDRKNGSGQGKGDRLLFSEKVACPLFQGQKVACPLFPVPFFLFLFPLPPFSLY